MKLRYLFLAHMLVALVLAAGLLLSPKTILGLLGISVGTTVGFNASLNFVAQLLGAAMTLPGLLGWFAAGMTEPAARRSVAIALFVFQVVAFAVALLGMLAKAMSVAGWSVVILFLLLAAGYAYFLFVNPADA